MTICTSKGRDRLGIHSFISLVLASQWFLGTFSSGSYGFRSFSSNLPYVALSLSSVVGSLVGSLSQTYKSSSFLSGPRKHASVFLVFRTDDDYLICSSYLISRQKDWEKHTTYPQRRRGLHWLFSLLFYFSSYPFLKYVHPHFQIRTSIFCWIHLYQRKQVAIFSIITMEKFPLGEME